MRVNARLFAVAVATTALTALSPIADAFAQDLVKTRTVTTRERPELDPLGVRMGAFFLFPSLSASVTHDDNIYRTENNEVSDFIFAVTPRLRLNSNWSRHSLNLDAGANIVRYYDEDSEDYEDYNIGANGRVDITRRSNITAGASYKLLHEDRGSPDDANGVSPTEYSVTGFDAAFNQRFNRVRASVGAIFSQYDFDDVSTSSGSIVNNDDRDRNETEAFIRLGYEITPSYEAFVRLSANERDYDTATDDNGFNRDSDGWEARAGVRLDLGGIAFGDLYAGYQSQNYDDPSLQTVDGLSYGAALTWNATQLTTAKLDVSKSIGETTQNNVSGTDITSIRVTVDHELLRNMLIGGKAGFTNTEFNGTGREDDTTAVGVYAKYMMSRYFYATLGYDFESRDSTSANSDYDDNQLMLRITGQL